MPTVLCRYDPLRVYICRDGLVRFATQKYSNKRKTSSNRYMHLTNYSINKKSADFVENAEADTCQGHKWGLQALWRHLETDRGVDTVSHALAILASRRRRRRNRRPKCGTTFAWLCSRLCCRRTVRSTRG